MQNFYYCPPSNNLWTVNINLHNNSQVSGTDSESKSQTFKLVNLYENIISVNKNFKDSIGSLWNISTEGTDDTSGMTIKGFFDGFESVGNIFMAQSVVTQSPDIQDNANIFTDLGLHGGFIAPGRIIQNRNVSSLSCSINFLESNWSILDILIDPWMAAIAQNGLIKDSGKRELTADIRLLFYAQSAPHKSTEKQAALEMIPQKQITLYGAYPVSRDSLSDASYDFEKAGIYRNAVVRFNFEDYSIRYFI